MLIKLQEEEPERSNEESQLIPEFHEKVTHKFKAGISIRNLNKKFHVSDFVVLSLR